MEPAGLIEMADLTAAGVWMLMLVVVYLAFVVDYGLTGIANAIDRLKDDPKE